MHGPAGPPIASQANHSDLISSSDKLRSRACSALGALHAGAGRRGDHVALAQPVEELGQVRRARGWP